MFKKIFQKYQQCQTVWIYIRPDVFSGLIWVKTVCKGFNNTSGHQQLKTTKILLQATFLEISLSLRHQIRLDIGGYVFYLIISEKTKKSQYCCLEAFKGLEFFV